MDSDPQTRQLRPKMCPQLTISEAPLVSAGLKKKDVPGWPSLTPSETAMGPPLYTPEEKSHTQHRAYSVVWGGRLKSPEDDTSNASFTVNTRGAWQIASPQTAFSACEKLKWTPRTHI